MGNQPPNPCNVVDDPFPKGFEPPRRNDISTDEFYEWQRKADDAAEDFMTYSYLDRAIYLPIIPFSNRHSQEKEFEEVSDTHLSGKHFNWIDHGFDVAKNRFWGIAHPTIDGDEPESELIIELDPEQGMRPVEYMFRRIPKDGSDKAGEVYIRAKTDWEQYGDFWLPRQVALIDRSRGGNGEVVEIDKIEWWVGDDVPDEIFELKDFSKSCHEKSIIDELIAKRIKEREQSEKEKLRRRR